MEVWGARDQIRKSMYETLYIRAVVSHLRF